MLRSETVRYKDMKNFEILNRCQAINDRKQRLVVVASIELSEHILDIVVPPNNPCDTLSSIPNTRKLSINIFY